MRQIAQKHRMMSSYIEGFRYQRGQRDFEPKRGYQDKRTWAGP